MSEVGPEESAKNARQAMKLISGEVLRILAEWDPLCMKGLSNYRNEYREFIGPIAVLVRKRREPEEIGRHLLGLQEKKWHVPVDRAETFKVAQKLYRAGSFLD